MKKFFGTLFALITSFNLFALPVGNPADATLLRSSIIRRGSYEEVNSCKNNWDAWGLKAGFYGDYVYNRKLASSSPHRHIRKTALYTNAGYWALNFAKRIDCFGTLGVTNFSIDTTLTSLNGPGLPNLLLQFETDTTFSWSVGGRVTLWECRGFMLGVEGQYFKNDSRYKYVNISSIGHLYLDGYKLTYKEWQAGLGVSYEIPIAGWSTSFVPYLAIKWARGYMDNTTRAIPIPTVGTVALESFKSDRYFGYAIGLTLLGCDKVTLTAEGRFIDEKALYFSTQFRF